MPAPLAKFETRTMAGGPAFESRQRRCDLAEQSFDDSGELGPLNRPQLDVRPFLVEQASLRHVPSAT